MVSEADHDKSGHIDYAEFEKAMGPFLGSAEAQGRLGAFGRLIVRKAKTGPPMRWVDSKVGQGVRISEDKMTVSRNSADGWGVQLFDAWLANAGAMYNLADVMLEVEQVTGGALFVGVVGRNFWPSEWDKPLVGNKHAVGVELGKGALWRKELKTDLLLGAASAGQRVHLQIDMVRQELTIDLLGPDNVLLRSVAVGDLPAEVTVAVCMGPGAQKLRIIGSSSATAVSEASGKQLKDLWDEDNVQSLDVGKKLHFKDNPASVEAVAASLE